MHRRTGWLGLLAVLLLGVPAARAAEAPQDIIIDTDAGDDLDDAFAIALALRQPSLQVDALVASFGDTALRARLLRGLLAAAGRPDIPVAAGPATPPGTIFSQAAWASRTAAGPVPDGVSLVLDRLRTAPPGRITLVALAPPVTLGAMMARDPVAFRRLRRIVMMGGSIRRGYGSRAGTTSAHPSAGYNVVQDPEGFRAVLASGVPVVLMPIDATDIALDAPARTRLFSHRADPLVATLAALYREWARVTKYGPDPTLFDVVPVAWLIDPSICRPQPLRLAITGDGRTREMPGTPNVAACLASDAGRVRALVAGLPQGAGTSAR